MDRWLGRTLGFPCHFHPAILTAVVLSSSAQTESTASSTDAIAANSRLRETLSRMASHELNGTKEKKAVMILDETKEESAAIETSNKSFYDKVWPVIACGAG